MTSDVGKKAKATAELERYAGLGGEKTRTLHAQACGNQDKHACHGVLEPGAMIATPSAKTSESFKATSSARSVCSVSRAQES